MCCKTTPGRERIRGQALGSTVGTLDSDGNLVNTTVYAAFGGMSYAAGTLPTDKTFTGQRLDSTGLYYYGARYYDPAIGRFISPDTIVQSPANPQTLNRYSYCLNNPLVFIDPSGHEVDIQGTDVNTLRGYDAVRIYYQDPGIEAIWSSNVYEAYNVAYSIDSYYLQKMEQSDIEFNIISNEYSVNSNGSIIGGQALYEKNSRTMNIEIFRADVYTPNSVNLLTEFIAHESIHAFARIIDPGNSVYDSQYEEAVAYRYEYMICQNLGVNPSDTCKNAYYGDTNNQSFLNQLFGGTLYDTANGYSTLPHYNEPQGVGMNCFFMAQLSCHVNEWRNTGVSFY